MPDVDNEVLREADEYLRRHKILELFEVSINTLLMPIGSYDRSLLQTTRKHGRLPRGRPQAEKTERQQKYCLQ